MRGLTIGLTGIAGAMFLATPALAQRDLSKVEIKIEKIAPGVAVLFGAGGNIGLSYGEDGNVLIDDQFAPLSDKISAAVKTLDNDPVTFLINTHWHGDHSGGNENFGKAGTIIVAHDNVRARMAVEQVRDGRKTPASPKAALPVLTFADGVTFHLNGDDLDVIHVADAHTDGDSMIRFRKANVLHMGDTFFHKMSLPFIDRSSGGTIDGLIAAAEKGLALSDDATRIIPGHGPMATRVDLLSYAAMLKDVRGKIAAAKAAGKTMAQVKANNPARTYEIKEAFISADAFAEAVYDSLK